jgi:hypothetical protein
MTGDAYFGQRLPSGIAGWRDGWIAGIGSEGTRPALLLAGPVSERQTKADSARKLERPAIRLDGSVRALHDLEWVDLSICGSTMQLLAIG